jgi:hypothetical protein
LVLFSYWCFLPILKLFNLHRLRLRLRLFGFPSQRIFELDLFLRTLIGISLSLCSGRKGGQKRQGKSKP